MRLKRSEGDRLNVTCFECVSALSKSQTVAFIRLQTWSLLKGSAIFKRGLAFWLFVELKEPGRNRRLPGRMEAFLLGMRRLDPTKNDQTMRYAPM